MSLIPLVYTIALFVITTIICVCVGARRGTFNSALRLGFFLVSGILAFIVTRLLAPVLGNALIDAAKDLLEEAQSVLNMPTLRDLLATLIGGLVAPLIFLPIFFIIDKLSFIAYVPLRKKLANHESLHNIPNDKLYGALLGVVLSFCITLSCVMPIGGYPHFISQTLHQISGTSLTQELIPEETLDTIDEITGYSGVKVDYAISGWLFNGLVTDTRSFVKEVNGLIAVVDSITSAKTPADITNALAEIPPQTIATVAGIAKDAVSELASDDSSPFSGVAGLLLDGLETLPELHKELGDEGYKKELEVISTIVMGVQDPESVNPESLIKTAFSSEIVKDVILTNADAVADELSEQTSSLTSKEKEQIKEDIQQQLNEANVTDEFEQALDIILGLR